MTATRRNYREHEFREEKSVKRKLFILGLAPLTWLALPAPAADEVDAMAKQGEARIKEGQESQQQIDKLADQTGDLVSEYRTVIKMVEGLRIYNDLLQKQVDNQLSEIDALTESIDQVSLIERQVVPLMVRMIDSLEEFISLDVPFLPDERSERVASLRAMMLRADVTAAEKFRRVLEAYQIEGDYGRTIEAYKGNLELDGSDREVDFLRIGRVVLIYQAPGGDSIGVWDHDRGGWRALPAAEYRQQVAQGLRMARAQVPPDLLTLPVPAPREAGR